jgi:flap endonuclease GEN
MENWHTRICDKIAKEPNFPKDEIIDMYLCNDNGYFSGTWTEMKIIIDIFFFSEPETVVELFEATFYKPNWTIQLIEPWTSTVYSSVI